MRSLIVMGLFLLVSQRLPAQHPGFELMKNPDAFKSVFQEAAKKTTSIKSDFIQEKTLSLLSDKIVSKGKFWFEKENKVRMEYTQPFPYLLIMNNGKIFVKDGQKENKVSTGSNKVFQQVNRIMLDCVGGTILSNPDFSAKIYEGPKSYLLDLTPLAKNLRALYSSISILIDKKDYSATSLGMTELSGDTNLIRFLNKEPNVPLAASLFVIP